MIPNFYQIKQNNHNLSKETDGFKLYNLAFRNASSRYDPPFNCFSVLVGGYMLLNKSKIASEFFFNGQSRSNMPFSISLTMFDKYRNLDYCINKSAEHPLIGDILSILLKLFLTNSKRNFLLDQ